MDRDEMIRSWEAKTGLEKILIMTSFVFCVMILGFIVGVAALKATERGNQRQIMELKERLEECEANLPNRSSTTVITTTSTVITTSVSSTAMRGPKNMKIFNSLSSTKESGYLTSRMVRAY